MRYFIMIYTETQEPNEKKETKVEYAGETKLNKIAERNKKCKENFLKQSRSKWQRFR